ncbi:MAG TPA: carboxypeptidase-like regulatory domain-containing protein, partial [Kofleriaceae bacterium]
GIVVDESGAPVDHASVSVGDGSGFSDAKGHFEIVGIKPGNAEITATSDHGAAVVTTRAIAIGAPLDLHVVVMTGTLAGIVRDHHGEGVADVMIDAKRIGGGGEAWGRSEDDGHFDLGGVPPGEYEIVISRRADRTPMPEHSGITAKSGRHDIALTIAGLGGISGRVVDHGTPVTYYGVGVAEDVDRASPDPIRDDAGAFELHDLPPGRYQIVIVGTQFAQTVVRDVAVREDETTDLGGIQVDRGRVIRGTVRDPSGRPIAGARVAASRHLGSGEDDGINEQARGLRTATTDANGAYELAGVDLERFDIEASLKTERSERVRVTTGDVVDLVLAPTGAIAGRVINGRGGTETLSAASNGSNLYADTDGLGAFTFERLPPGDYDLSLFYSDVIGPDLKVHVEAGATATVELAFPAAPISVTVSRPDCKKAWLMFGGRYLEHADCTDGVAVFSDVASGDYDACDDDEHCTPITVRDQPIRIQIPDPPEPAPADVPVETEDL